MSFNYTKAFISATLYILLHVHRALSVEANIGPKPANSYDDPSEEYCLMETFKPRCLKNEVILMTSARYGRMRIGRCVTSEEVAEQGSPQEQDPRFLGCSTDLLEMLDQKCSGKTECEIRVWDISIGNNLPCFRGLKMYLEVSYVCISIVDEERSCTVAATENVVHIVRSLSPSRMCGTKSQPWIVEASVGKRVNLTLLKVMTPPSATQMEELGRQPCYSHGIILDKVGKRNVSICGDKVQREKSLYLSSGNTVDIIFNQSTEKDSVNAGRLIIIKVEAIGCSDIIPPEDSWLKRNMDAIVMGCYSSRQTWQLSCNGGNWVGVLGNCSQVQELRKDSEFETKISSDEQVLAMVAIVGCTLAICLAIMCVGAVCLRRYHDQMKTKRVYKTLNYQISSSARSQTAEQRFLSDIATGDLADSNTSVVEMPKYSVYVGDGGLHDNVSYHEARLFDRE